jgi:hypothetical protein
MFRMSRLLFEPRLFRDCILLLAGMCLLFSLTPFIDSDSDGSPDSLVADGIILAPALVILFLTLLSNNPIPLSVPSPEYFSILIVPPPICF